MRSHTSIFSRRICYRYPFAVKTVLDALVGYLFQHPFILICQRETFGISKDGEGMIAHDATMVVVIDVARVLIQQMFHLVLSVHHQHQRGNSQLPTSTRRQIANTTLGIAFKGGNKRRHIATLHSLSRLASTLQASSYVG